MQPAVQAWWHVQAWRWLDGKLLCMPGGLARCRLLNRCQNIRAHASHHCAHAHSDARADHAAAAHCPPDNEKPDGSLLLAGVR